MTTKKTDDEKSRARVEGEIYAFTAVLDVFAASRSFGPCNLDGIEVAIRSLRETSVKRLAELEP